jgi:peptidyl-tRNA hydrolase
MLVQYLILTERLTKEWGMGPAIAQAAHAVSGCLAKYWTDESIQDYIMDLPSMHKVILSVENVADLETLAESLRKGAVDFYAWREQPEDVCSALAIKPYEATFIKPYVKHLKLFPRTVK